LALGISCCILVFVYLRFEFSYDRHHDQGERIFRLVSERKIGEVVEQTANSPFPAGPELARVYPEIAQSTRLLRATNGASVGFEDHLFIEDLFFFADENVFDVFTYKFVAGTSEAALSGLDHVVITERAAQKYFGNENPIGQRITARLLNRSSELVVTGVVQNPPANSHFQFDFLTPFESPINGWIGAKNVWESGTLGAWTYLMLSDIKSAETLESKFPEFVSSYLPEEAQQSIRFSLQPLYDIHFHSHLIGELDVNGQIIYSYIFAVIGFLVLLIACVNFVNLAAAQSVKRAKEVGVRKAMGAKKSQLVGQFLSEAFVLSLVAILLALVIAKSALPYFSHIFGKPLSIDLLSGEIISSLVVLWILTGFLAGSYPAFVISQFDPVKAIQRKVAAFNVRKVSFGQGLIVFQFAVSTILLVVLWGILNQVDYVKTKGLGFNKEQLIVIAGANDISFDLLKNELQKNPEILGVTVTARVPGGRQLRSSLFHDSHDATPVPLQMHYLRVEKDFLSTLQFELIEGKDFDGSSERTVIINERAAEELGWQQEVIGRELVQVRNGQEESKRVIGVIKDVHYESLYAEVKPLVLSSGINFGSRIIVRMSPGDIAGSLDYINATWNELSPDSPLDFYFLDEDINRMYAQEERLSNILKSVTILALIITHIGLFGLLAFFAEQRTREIGIRKILGASAIDNLHFLSRQYGGLILLSMIIALPLAYTIMDWWLQNFAYRTPISGWTFIGAMGIVLLFASSMFIVQTIKVSLINPTQMLKYD